MRFLQRLHLERRLPYKRMTNILLRLSWRLPYEVKQVEVTCQLMYADFPPVCLYTQDVRKWVDH